jgi:hypothetical protein
MNRALALILSILIGFAGVAIPAALQPRLLAGSIPDLICSVMLAPGTMVANLLLDRGILNPAFLPLSRSITFILFGGVAYGFLSVRKPAI